MFYSPVAQEFDSFIHGDRLVVQMEIREPPPGFGERFEIIIGIDEPYPGEGELQIVGEGFPVFRRMEVSVDVVEYVFLGDLPSVLLGCGVLCEVAYTVMANYLCRRGIR